MTMFAVSGAGRFEVRYFATIGNATNQLGSLFTDIGVIGKLNHTH